MISASAIAATTAGSAEKLRSSAPIAGFVGLTLTSTTGARSRSIPAAAIVSAIARPASNASSGSSVAPISACDRVSGNPRAGFSRETRPPSWSIAIEQAARSRLAQRGGQRRQLRRRLDVPRARDPVLVEQDHAAQPAGEALVIGSPGPIVNPRKPTISSRPILRRRAAGSLVGAGVSGAAVGVGDGDGDGDGLGGGVGEAGGAVELEADGLGVAGAPQAASPAATEPAASPRRSVRREIRSQATTSPQR